MKAPTKDSANATKTPEIRAEYDLHCHVLPAWDDGPRSLEDSLALVERAASCGTKIIFATPHVGRSFNGIKHSSSEIAAGVEKLQAEIDARGLGVQIRPGAELLMGAIDISTPAGVKNSWTYGQEGHYALIESPMRVWPPFGNHIVQEMLRRGVTTILAHPERYLDVQKSLETLRPSMSQGALVQITAGALLGEMGRDAMRCCHKLMEAGWVHFIASDAHDAKHTMPGEVISQVIEMVGEARARQIFVDNPRSVVNGERLPIQVNPQVNSSSLWQRLFSRNNRN